MNEPAIRRYERALGREIKGFRRRKEVRKSFHCSLALFLEEQPAPTWADLEEAFGPPDQMARDLMENIPDLPQPFSIRWKVGIMVAIFAIVAVGCVGIYCWSNRPESEVKLTDGNEYTTERVLADYTSRLNEVFQSHDYTWTQQGSEYLILLENTSRLDVTVRIQYSDRQPDHVFVVPVGESCAFRVEDARPTKHVLSINTPDGAMSGRIQLLFPIARN